MSNPSHSGRRPSAATTVRPSPSRTASFPETRPPTHPTGQPVQIGPYRILETLGQGGMGTVYLAEQSEPFERQVAIKLLRWGGADGELAKRFRAEGQALARLSHPNIAQVYDAATTEQGQPYFVLELVDGEPLTQYCRQRSLHLPAQLELFATVCETLAHAHERGILHRDIKPSNVLVTEVGGTPMPKVIDFGIAKSLEQPLADGTLLTGDSLLGTPAYMSPEALGYGEEPPMVDVRSEVYALGVMLYELLVGDRPFGDPSDSLPRLLKRILTETPRRASTRLIAERTSHELRWPARRLRTELDPVVEKAMARRPDDRYQNAAELARDVRRFVDGTPVKAARPSTAIRLRRLVAGPERRGWRAGLGALAAAALVVGAVSLWPGREVPPEPAAPPPIALEEVRAVAVLPLIDLSPAPGGEYFVEGLTEALITDLAHVGSLRVTARTSSMRFAGSGTPLPQIAEELGVDALLEGTVLREGRKVRVTARLVRGSDEVSLWNRSYERDVSEVLPLQRELAMAIADEIRVELTPKEEQRLKPPPPMAAEALELYLKGRFFWNKRTVDGLDRSIDALQAAAEIEPDNALIFAGLADSYALLPSYGYADPMESYRLASDAAMRAMQLEETLGEAEAALALVHHEYERDWEAAEKSFAKALELAPNYATAHQWYAEHLTRLGRHEEAVTAIHRAVMLDPLSLIANAIEGWVLLAAGRLEDASAQLERTLELDATFVPAIGYLAEVHLARGEPEKAVERYREAVDVAGDSPRYLAGLGVALAQAGRSGAARDVLERLESLNVMPPVPAWHRARLHYALGDEDAAFAALDSAVAEGGVWILSLRIDPLFAPLAGDPRFEAVAAQVGLARAVEPPSSDA